LAAGYHEKHGSPEAAIDALIAWQTGAAGAAGFVTGLGGAVTLPVALPAHFVSTLYIQVRLVTAIAHLRGYDIQSDETRLGAFACLAGSAAADRLKTVGVNAGTQFTQQMIARLPAEAVKNLGGVAGFYFVRRAGQHGAVNLTRLLPVLGGVIAGGFDAAATRMIGHAAKKLFVPRPEPEAAA
jgi:hypothetical protein